MARGSHADAVRALEHRWLEETSGDADLGQPDLGQMLGVGGDPNDPAIQLLQGLLGQLGGNGGPGQQQDLLRGLMDALGGGGP